ncbi:MAG TPA: GNAT family N-acetyltransferase [Acidimicrobiales bacterium]
METTSTPLPVSLSVRPSGPGDRERLDAFVDRCSPATLYRRFHGAGERPARREMARVAAPSATHRSWVAVSPGGDIRGVATLAWGPTAAGAAEDTVTVEAAFMVEDDWARRGVGRMLFAALVDESRRERLPGLRATVQADNERAVRFLLAVAPGARSRYAGDAEIEVMVPVTPAVPRKEAA